MTELLDTQKIIAYTTPAHRAKLPQLLTFDELTSTNDYLLQHAEHFAHTTVACLAERQISGRGRLGRTWVSPHAVNIYLSLLWHFRLNVSQLAGLNMVVGISIVEAIQSIVSIPDLMLKWPNDIYWHDQKLGGILIDIAGETNNITSVVIGIGINVNMPDTAAHDIHKPWIDLTTAAQQSISRNQLAGILIERLMMNLIQFQMNGASIFTNKWKSIDYLAGKHISITADNISISGIAQGVNEQGQLLLLTDAGTIKTISAGEASVLL